MEGYRVKRLGWATGIQFAESGFMPMEFYW
eukprot:COSAG06_NODE_46810_length_344_cov_0.632653_2_plen_29_part_01